MLVCSRGGGDGRYHELLCRVGRVGPRRAAIVVLMGGEQGGGCWGGTGGEVSL